MPPTAVVIATKKRRLEPSTLISLISIPNLESGREFIKIFASDKAPSRDKAYSSATKTVALYMKACANLRNFL
jgi:hypothetical protein